MRTWPAGGVAFGSGALFATGLAISGMGRPGKVLAFLDVAGAWDPSLVFVMASAIAVHVVFAQRARRGARPLFAPVSLLPTSDTIDLSLVLGAALFGVGWGLSGYCPGPAVVATTTLNVTPLVFVLAMLVGLLAPRFLDTIGARWARPRAGATS